jgi:hypothetical protein
MKHSTEYGHDRVCAVRTVNQGGLILIGRRPSDGVNWRRE